MRQLKFGNWKHQEADEYAAANYPSLIIYRWIYPGKNIYHRQQQHYWPGYKSPQACMQKKGRVAFAGYRATVKKTAKLAIPEKKSQAWNIRFAEYDFFGVKIKLGV